MDSIHLKKLSDSLASLILFEIKEKIAGYYNITKNEKTLITLSTIIEKYGKQINVKIISSEFIKLENDESITWEEIRNINDLLIILEFLEKKKKTKKNNSIFIEWSICDFETRASEIEERENVRNILFDRSRFSFALKILEDRHDCNFGINWHDLDDILFEFCCIRESISMGE